MVDANDESESAPEGDPIAQAGRRSPRIPIVIAVLAVAAFAVALFLFLRADGDKKDAEDALATTQSELDQANNQLSTSQQGAADLQNELDSSEESLSEAQVQLVEAEVQLEDAAETREGVIDFLVTSFGLALPMTDSQGTCFAEALLVDLSVSELLGGLTGAALDPLNPDLALVAGFLSAAGACDIPIDVLGGGSPLFGGGSAFTYGDDPVFDALQDQCAAGSGSACDELFFQSPIGSDYESFGNTCGERFTAVEAPDTCEGSI